MQNKKAITSLLSLIFFVSSLSSLSSPNFLLNKKVLNSIAHKGPYSQSIMEDLPNKEQKLYYQIIGLHTRSCRVALSRLSQYARYKEWVFLVKESRYLAAQQRIYLKISHILLPFSMGIDFKLPVIKKPGQYPFQFDKGFLKNLVGTIHVQERQGRCLFYTQALWQGPHTGIPSSLFSLFSQTLGVLTMKKLFSISRTY